MEGTILETIEGVSTNLLLTAIFVSVMLVFFINLVGVLSSSTRVYRLNKWFRALPRKIKNVFKKV